LIDKVAIDKTNDRKNNESAKQPAGCFFICTHNNLFPEGLMQFHFGDFITAANLFVLLGIYRKMSIVVYQHKLMWADFAERKGISPNGKHAASV
jgi:hypothetical protein